MPLTQVSPGLLDTQANAQGFRNRIINGDCRVDQRNAGASVFNAFVVDRFYGSRGSATATYARSTVAPTGFTNSIALTVTTGAATGASDTSSIQQGIEGFNVADLGWGTANAQTITLSFWARSSVTGNYGAALRNGSGNRSYVASYTISAANTWEYKTLTIAGDTSGTWATDNTAGIYLNFDTGVGSTFSTTAGSWQAGNFLGLSGGTKVQTTTGATFYITGVQLEKGTVATDFERLDYGRQLIQCQRYFIELGNNANQRYGIGWWTTSTTGYPFCPTPVTMRAPGSVSVSFSSLSHFAAWSGGTSFTPTQIAMDSGSNNGISLRIDVASGATTGWAIALIQTNSSAKLSFSNEL